jgi:hypothetical protein
MARICSEVLTFSAREKSRGSENKKKCESPKLVAEKSDMRKEKGKGK